MYCESGTTNFQNCIVAQNGAPTGPDVENVASANDDGGNLIGADTQGLFTTSTLVGTLASPLDPKLVALADNGGPTLTEALQPGSPATNAGVAATLVSVTTDQRGAPRPTSTPISIGAFEPNFSPFPVASVSPSTVDFAGVPMGSPATNSVTVANTGTAPLTIKSITIGGAPNNNDFTLSPIALPVTVAAGSTFTIPVTFNPTAQGNRFATLVINDNSGGVQDDGLDSTAIPSHPGSMQTVALQGLGLPALAPTPTPSPTVNPNTPDYIISADPLAATIQAGQSASFKITVTPENGFNQPITFSASGLPNGATATFNPPTVTPNGGPVTTVLTITTTAPSTGALPTHKHALLASLPIGTLVACLLFIGLGDARKLRIVTCLLVLCMVGGLVGCGGGESSGTFAPNTNTGGNNNTGGTPKGTSTVTVQANASGGANHNVAITLTIQ